MIERVFLLLLLSFAFSIAVDQEGSGFGNIISSLEKFQAENGGFRLQHGEEPTIEATSNALSLASLYGLTHKINSEGVLKFVQTLINSDNGYGKEPNANSDLESVRQTVLTYKHLGSTVPNQAGLLSFIQKLQDSQSGLYGSKAGDKGTLRLTSFAFHTLALLDAEKSIKAETKTLLNKYLKSITKEAGDFKYFSPSGASSASDNFYGISIGLYTGFDFGDLSKWVNFIVATQSPSGSFYTDLNKKETTLEASLHSVGALHCLQQLNKGKPSLFERINGDSLNRFVKSVGRDLRSAFQANSIAVLSKGFASQFHTTVSYEGVEDNTIVEGTQVKPVLSIHSLDGIPHPSLQVELGIQAQGESKAIKLEWKEEGQHYVAETAYPTTGKLGPITFQYTIGLNSADLGHLVHTIADHKTIGYGVNIVASAQLAGKDYEEGETIGIGTEFNFGLTLHTQTVDNIDSGDFEVIFTVLDSSHAPIHTQTLDAKQNKKPFQFSYALKNAAIPAGEIVARFEIANKRGVHTTESISYNLAIPMIATQITFDKFNRKEVPKFKIGDTIVVSIGPASFPDLRSVHQYTGDLNIVKQHRFFLDVHTPQGTRKHSIEGVPSLNGGKAIYTFTDLVDASLEELGLNIVSFRYRTFNGRDILLSNFDSTIEELYDETISVNYTVNSELHVVEMPEKLNKDDFTYGNDIVFKFKVKDAITNQIVVANAPELANVYLSLKHAQSGKSRTFTSTNQPAHVVRDAQGKITGFRIEWSITPNAVRGLGLLTLSVQDVDGILNPLYKEKSKDEVQFNVNIGGEISVKSETSTFSSFDSKQSGFLTQFHLECNKKRLKDAQLKGSVVYHATKGDVGVELFQLPVATNDEGLYEVSWVVPSQKAKTGEYQLKFLREVDRLRTDQATSEEASEPLFKISFHYEANNVSNFPVKTELFAALLLGLLFFWINAKRADYNKV